MDLGNLVLTTSAEGIRAIHKRVGGLTSRFLTLVGFLRRHVDLVLRNAAGI